MGLFSIHQRVIRKRDCRIGNVEGLASEKFNGIWTSTYFILWDDGEHTTEEEKDIAALETYVPET